MAAEKSTNLIDPIHQFVITRITDIKIGNVIFHLQIHHNLWLLLHWQ